MPMEDKFKALRAAIMREIAEKIAGDIPPDWEWVLLVRPVGEPEATICMAKMPPEQVLETLNQTRERLKGMDLVNLHSQVISEGGAGGAGGNN